MAKRQATRAGTRNGRQASASSGPARAALAVVAAVLAGGTYLYRHTGVPARPAALSPPARDSTQPRSAPQPLSLKPAPTPSAPAAAPVTSGAPQKLPLPPFGTSEEVFESGARLYAANCAGCHGRPGKDGNGPLAAQFWSRTNPAGSQAIAQPAGALYQATAVGNLMQGMPSYGQRLTDTQIWDLALLLKSAHEELPEPVLRLLHSGQ